jgi:hypothetical protein
MKALTAIAAAVASLSLIAAHAAMAQLVPSEKALVAQTVDGTRMTVEYSRPRMRGRTTLLGTVEPWGRAWTPGADDATTLEVSKPVRVLGKPVPAGKYSVWMVLRETGPWTLVLDPRAGLFHTQHPDSTPAQIRAQVAVQPASHVEALTWSFPTVGVTGATLEMRWGTRSVSIPIEITPTFPLTVTAADAAPYLGEYVMTSESPAAPFTIIRRGEALIGQRSRPGEPAVEFQLLPLGNDRFVQGEMFRGELWRTNAGWTIEFQRSGGQATGFEIRRDGRRVASGERRPGG